MRLRWRAVPLRNEWKAAGVSPPAGLSRDDAAHAALAEALLLELAAGNPAPLVGLAPLLERQLAPADPDSVRRVLRLIETLQNACSWDYLPGPEAVLPLLGPYAMQAWESANEFWARVTTSIPPKPKALDEVENQKLRWILISTSRQVSPGRYTDLADVVRYERGY